MNLNSQGMKSIVLTFACIIVIFLVSSFVSPSYLPLVKAKSVLASESETRKIYVVELSNLSLRSFEVCGIRASCSCVDRPTTPFTIAPWQSHVLSFEVDKSAESSSFINIVFLANAPHEPVTARLLK